MGVWDGVILTFYNEEEAKKVWDGLQDENGEFSLENVIPDPNEDEDSDDWDWRLDNWGFADIYEPILEGKMIKFQTHDGIPNPKFLQTLSEMFNVRLNIIAWAGPGYFFESGLIPIRFPNFRPEKQYNENDDNNDYVIGWFF